MSPCQTGLSWLPEGAILLISLYCMICFFFLTIIVRNYLLMFVCLLLPEYNLHKGRGFVSFTVTFPALRKSVWPLRHHTNTCCKGLRTISYCASLQHSSPCHRWGLQSHWNIQLLSPPLLQSLFLSLSCLHLFCLVPPLLFFSQPSTTWLLFLCMFVCLWW